MKEYSEKDVDGYHSPLRVIGGRNNSGSPTRQLRKVSSLNMEHNMLDKKEMDKLMNNSPKIK